MSDSAYVCAFRGRRDGYQVPLALAEAGRLDRLITDAWAGPRLRRLPLPASLRGRWEPGVPDGRVRCLWGTTLHERFRHRLGFSRTATWARLDAEFSRAAAARARRTGADLFLYSPYAWEAFTAAYGTRRTPRRVMFQYHPHAAVENPLLDADARQFPEVARSHAEATGERLPADLQRRNADGWQHADLCLCASSFTRDSLLAAGADPARCAVVPYGVDLPPENAAGGANGPDREGFHALFVGSGVQRKGLHHLLTAWGRARLPADRTLTLVCRNLDPGLEAAVARCPATRLLRGTGGADLQRLYADSTLFVMPSLTEGFGQVFIEALGAGCPVLGTAHTCLPDLGGEEDGIFLTEVANAEHLVHNLERLSALLPARPGLRAAARARARAFPWTRFRAGLRALVP